MMTTQVRSRITLALRDEFVRRIFEDPRPYRGLLETLIADQDALTAFQERLEALALDIAPVEHGSEPPWPGQDLIDQVVQEGMCDVPEAVLVRLVRDVDALLTLQVEVQLKDIQRANEGDTSDWFWDRRRKQGETEPPSCPPVVPAVTPVGNADVPDGLVEVLPASLIGERIRELTAAIAADFAGRTLMIVPIMTGGCFFAMDLHRGLGSLGPRFDPIVARSYDGTEAGRVRVDLDMLDRIPFAGRHVLVVDDILDTGQTLTEVTRLIRLRGPASLRTCILLRKDRRDAGGRPTRPYPFWPDYLGFDVRDTFVVGYGLDFEGAYRELPGIYELPRSTLRAPEDHGLLIRLVGYTDPRPTALHALFG